MSSIEIVIDNLHEMQRIAKSLQEHQAILDKMPAELQSFGYNQKEIEKQLHFKTMEIKKLVKEYKGHTKTQFEALRAFEVQGAEPIDFTFRRYTESPLSAWNSAEKAVRERNQSLLNN